MTPQTMKKKLTLPKLGTVSDYRHFWMLSFWILYLVLFFVVEKLITTDYWVSYLPLDDKIPFCEYFIVPYCMWHPLLFLMTIYLAFYDVETFRKYMWFVLAGLVSAIVVCWIFPNGQDLRPAEFPRHNVFTWMVSRIYAADTNTNVCPSMHVIGYFYLKKRGQGTFVRQFIPTIREDDTADHEEKTDAPETGDGI